MIYGSLLAGGSGTRVKSANIPKQFVEINGRPIIVYTLNSMLKVKRFDRIYIACREDYIDYLKGQISENSDPSRVSVIPGGKERMDSIRCVTAAIEADYGINELDIIVIHDAVRPFVTQKILEDSIDCAAEYGACVCGLPCADTILRSEKGDIVDDIPPRGELYSGQAPDSFKLAHFIRMQNALSGEQKAVITGTSQICTMNGQDIHIIEGDAMNFKITTDSDLVIVRSLIETQKGSL